MAKKGLGRGLGSLFEDNVPILDDDEEGEDSVKTLKITKVAPNRNQPRRSFDKEKIDELAESVKIHGVIQPIIVVKDNDMYKIVAGERRWRAAKKAGLTEIPVIIKNYTDSEIAQISLIENLQRENLNPIEEAQGYQALLEDYKMTQEDVSRRIGKSRSAIANSVRLLTLDETTRSKLIAGEISSGHARALLSIEDEAVRTATLKSIIEKGLNVRQAETLAKQLQRAKPKKKTVDEAVQEAAADVENRLSEFLGTKVKLSPGAKKGKIEIEYYGNDDLDRILNIISSERTN